MCKNEKAFKKDNDPGFCYYVLGDKHMLCLIIQLYYVHNFMFKWVFSTDLFLSMSINILVFEILKWKFG